MKTSTIYKLATVLCLFGCFAVIAADIIGIILHEEHNPFKNTISMLAIGKYGWIQDLGLDFLAMGYVALAIGLFTWKKNNVRWLIGLVVMVLIGADLVMIAEHNQYAGRPGEKIHRKLVYILAGLFLILHILVYPYLKSLKPFLKKFTIRVGVLWLLLAPLLPLMPDDINGAYERFICSLLVIWPAVVSYYLWKSANLENAIHE